MFSFSANKVGLFFTEGSNSTKTVLFKDDYNKYVIHHESIAAEQIFFEGVLNHQLVQLNTILAIGIHPDRFYISLNYFSGN
ncbi:hypothetical protein EGR_01760 [Echinococcus granulosus]|uniref:Uncharacterized protein n=1 Tax=Echinococcus granulosus TaxID=6210 RepID=W6V9G8_ECHGR|nr:hypothetical protein EGR_01760 [Echinococcus granulosus]EUB63269.1 hypothetical protein EGR_01760 [Echinococcus granulosus]